jgi:hypothetical protein
VNIPDKVLRAMHAADRETFVRTGSDREAAMAGYLVIAEWARKEALLEAADEAEASCGGILPFADHEHNIAVWLRALAKGEPPHA